MSARDEEAGTVLVVVDDGDLLDVLTRLFESRGYRAAVAATLRSGVAHVEKRAFDAVVSGWRLVGGNGPDLYDRATALRPELRDRFVFLAEGSPGDLPKLAEGRCPVIDPRQLEEVVRVVDMVIGRSQRVRAAQLAESEVEWAEARKPAMLLVDDEPLELMAMRRLLSDLGFAVTPADSGNAAIARLESETFDVILSDWYMADGSGADLYRWLRANRPELAQRCVFMSGGSAREIASVAPGRPFIPKGQDSPTLVRTLYVVMGRPMPSPP